MPLLDHFHDPLAAVRPWQGFHHTWCTEISRYLNERLPPGYISSPNIRYGIEIDVAAFEELTPSTGRARRPEVPSTQDKLSAISVLEQTLELPVVSDVVEVLVYKQQGGLLLVGAIELVSPANKDRPDQRKAFTSKCAVLLAEGIGLLIIDVVTQRRGNLRDDLLALFGDSRARKLQSDLYVASYRPVDRDEHAAVNIWQQALQLNGDLPAMPLWLKGGICVPIDLAATYEQASRHQRIHEVVSG